MSSSEVSLANAVGKAPVNAFEDNTLKKETFI